MGRCIVKLAEDKYVEWSSVVDAPVTCILTRGQMKTHLAFRYGGTPAEIEFRMLRTDGNGTSLHDATSLEDHIRFNRAGPGESCLTLEQLIEAYTENGIQPDVD